jgi:hypothetical protein
MNVVALVRAHILARIPDHPYRDALLARMTSVPFIDVDQYLDALRDAVADLIQVVEPADAQACLREFLWFYNLDTPNTIQ